MIEVCHTIKEGKEYLTAEQIKAMLSEYDYIVTDSFARGEQGQIAEVLYKGNSEPEAKGIWKQNDTPFSTHLFCKYGAFQSVLRFNFDASDVKWDDDIPSASINYPIAFFEPDASLGDLVSTRQLNEAKEYIWYVVRVCDVDLASYSLMGQVAYKSASKQEAAEVWESLNEIYKDKSGLHRHHYIFNPAQE